MLIIFLIIIMTVVLFLQRPVMFLCLVFLIFLMAAGYITLPTH